MFLRDFLAHTVARLVPSGIFKDQRYFELWERHGYHVTPVHFYQPIPDTRTLGDRIFDRPSELPGLDLREQAQLELMRTLAADYGAEFAAWPDQADADPHRYHRGMEQFGSPDAELLYGMIRRHRPRHVIEIGSGGSTRLAAEALLMNARDEGEPGELTAIEPYPDPILKAGLPGLSRLVTSRVQDVPMEEFTRLGPDDVLFIDSSHVLSVGSDVQYEFLEILPRLASGVLVHIHDVHWPFEYSKSWILDRHLFWNEAYLLQAFLAFNVAFEILWVGSYIHHKYPEAIRDAFPAARGRLPGSVWIRRVR
jgi:hypothetical protein